MAFSPLWELPPLGVLVNPLVGHGESLLMMPEPAAAKYLGKMEVLCSLTETNAGV